MTLINARVEKSVDKACTRDDLTAVDYKLARLMRHVADGQSTFFYEHLNNNTIDHTVNYMQRMYR